MTEQWRPIPGYEGSYEVSDLGRVRSLSRLIEGRKNQWYRRQEKLLVTSPNSDGYPQVKLYSGKRQSRSLAVHRLILLAFVGPNPPGMEACHNDGDKSNCTLENLRWDTVQENALDRTRHRGGLRPHCSKGHQHNEKNTRIDPEGRRHCRTCAADRARLAYRKQHRPDLLDMVLGGDDL